MSTTADETAVPVLARPRLDAVLAARPVWLRRYLRVMLALDLVAALVLALVGHQLRQDAPRGLWLLALPLLWVAALGAGRVYEARFLGTGGEELRNVVNVCARLMAVLGLAAALWRTPVLFAMLLTLPAVGALGIGTRVSGRLVLARLRHQGLAAHRVVITGTERSVAELVRQLHRDRFVGLSVVAACIDRSRSSVVEGVPVMGTSDEVLAVVRRTGADVVALSAWTPLSQAGVRRLSWQLEGTGVSLVVAPSITGVVGPRLHVKTMAGMPMLHVEEPEFRGSRRVFKGLLDRALALLGVILIAPLLLVLAIAVRATTPGPAFFHQERVGRRGELFRVHKLRTMRIGAEAELTLLKSQGTTDGVLFKLQDDPRITRLGGVLRRYSLDELPQLFNVLKGEMSLVGPRPPLPSEVSQYEDDVHRRLLVKPGVTGLWQVSGRSDLPWAEAVRLDLHYVENWSIGLDLSILVRTVAAVLRRQGAY